MGLRLGPRKPVVHERSAWDLLFGSRRRDIIAIESPKPLGKRARRRLRG